MYATAAAVTQVSLVWSQYRFFRRHSKRSGLGAKRGLQEKGCLDLLKEVKYQPPSQERRRAAFLAEPHSMRHHSVSIDTLFSPVVVVLRDEDGCRRRL